MKLIQTPQPTLTFNTLLLSDPLQVIWKTKAIEERCPHIFNITASETGWGKKMTDANYMNVIKTADHIFILKIRETLDQTII